MHIPTRQCAGFSVRTRFGIAATLAVTLAVTLAAAAIVGNLGCSAKPGDNRPATATDAASTVTVYCALDLDLSGPIFAEFENRTGIKVNVVADTEATKTTGLVNRIIAEKHDPRADVFWNNEIAQTIRLQQAGLLAAYRSPVANDIPAAFKDADGFWTGFAARARIFIVNDEALAKANIAVPAGVMNLTDAAVAPHAGIAKPLFGTTLTHAVILADTLGDQPAREFLAKLRASGIAIESGNGPVAKKVGMGSYAIGLTDTDDAQRQILAGAKVRIVFPDQGQDAPGCVVLPNSIALVKGAPNIAAAQKLIDYVLSREVEQKLAEAPGAQIPVRADVPRPAHVANLHDGSLKVMPLDYARLGEIFDATYRWLQADF